MHEMAVAQSLLEMAEAEVKRLKCSRILAVTVHYGQISGIMPEALQFAFAALIHETPHAEANLEMILLPLKMRCAFCGARFEGKEDIFAPCPQCGEEIGHIVEQGRELVLARVVAQ